MNTELIPKLPGRRSRDFNLFDAMQADGKVKLAKSTYKTLIVSHLGWLHLFDHVDHWLQASVQTAIKSSDINQELPLKDQEQNIVLLVVALVCPVSPCHCIPRQPIDLLTRLRNSSRSSRSIVALGQCPSSCNNTSTTTAIMFEHKPRLLPMKQPPPMWIPTLEGPLPPPLTLVMVGVMAATRIGMSLI